MGIGQDRLLAVAKAAEFFQTKFLLVRNELQRMEQLALSGPEVVGILTSILNEGDCITPALVIRTEVAHFTPNRLKMNAAAAFRQRRHRAIKERGEKAYVVMNDRGQFVGDVSDVVTTSPAAREYLAKSGMHTVETRSVRDQEIEQAVEDLMRQQQTEKPQQAEEPKQKAYVPPLPPGEESHYYKQPTPDDLHDVPNPENPDDII